MTPLPAAQDLVPSMAARFDVVTRYAGGEGWSGAVRPKGGGEVRFLKVLDRGAGINEPSLLASLRHPGIPAVLETGTCAEGLAFLLREHLDGVPLGERLPLDVASVRDMAVQLLEILAFVHLRGVLHLDIKPANVLCCAGDAAPGYALLDFGLGRRDRGPATGGTYVFASPEVFLGIEPDARSDLFSLGALLYVALRAPQPLPAERFRRLFPQESFFEVIGGSADDLPEPFDTLLPRLVARRPVDRFRDAQEALEALTGGSGRPSVALLRPDPIRAFGAPLERLVEDLEDADDLVIEGGDSEDRHALALHAACRLVGVTSVENASDTCRLRRGDGTTARFVLPALDRAGLADHLVAALGLHAEAADGVAERLLGAGARSAAQVGRRLVELVESGAIQPDGPRWIWPDAMAGRVGSEDAVLLESKPLAVRDAAARGHVEAARAAYQRAAPRLDAEAERVLRAALVEGFLRGGEPARARPLVHDLPAHRVRVLLDLGEVSQAEVELKALAAGDRRTLLMDEHQIARLQLQLEHARGDLVAAEATARALCDDPGAVEDRVVFGLVLARRGHSEEAARVLGDVLAELDPATQPFLRAAALTNLAEAERAGGEPARAESHHTEASRLYRGLGHVRYSAMASINLGVTAKDLGRPDEALSHLRRARSLYAHVGDRDGCARAEADLGIVALESGDLHSAVRRLQGALTELERLGSRQPQPLLLVMLARAWALLGQHAEAARCLEQAEPLPEGRAMNEADRVRELLAGAVAPSPTVAPRPMEPRPMEPLPTETTPLRRAALDGAFRTFVQVNRRLAGEVDLERAMQFLLDAAVTLTGGRLGYLLVLRPGGVRMEVRVGQSGTDNVAYSRSLVNRAIQQRRMLTGDDARADQELMEMPSVRDLRQRSAICAPFVAASGTEGAVYVEHAGRSGVFGEPEKEILDVLADQAAIAVDRMLHEERLAAELEQSQRELRVAEHALRGKKNAEMIGKSKPIRTLRAEIQKLASSELAVLVLGETGSGKELVARALHEQSARRGQSFVAENCSAIPADLMESELFGHQKGAFTGAEDDRPGLLELASGGTLFLDEIGDMPLELQAKLLRALQEGCIRRLGGQRTITVDLRIVAATHRDLHEMITAGTFRSDLYYRIAAAEIRVPPLRERGRDIVLLADAFLTRLNRQHRRDVTLSAAGADELLGYPWPGNVRELEHVMARAFLLADGGELADFQLPAVVKDEVGEVTVRDWPVMTLADAEARTIRAALEHTHGDKTQAAKVLGISRTALYAKLERMNKREA